jgi:hypothetical protein
MQTQSASDSIQQPEAETEGRRYQALPRPDARFFDF